jgi:dihydrofolate synthase / folylpolyglutamate synthase
MSSRRVEGPGSGRHGATDTSTGSSPGGQSWSGERAERHLRSLELFGMRFGLDRVRRMMTALDSPQRRFHTVHVVGTNGKTSTTRMIAAILERHGLRTGAYLSPHLISYSERVQVGERDIAGPAFAAAVARAAWAAERVNRTLAADDHVTQFELLTAAAFWALAEEGVEVAVVEAGLGGRYDATAVVESAVTVLTTVGLEHTRWLGPTVRDIAAEKLAVLRPGSTLALGADLHPDALALARATAAEREARLVQVSAEEVAAVPLAAFQRRNFALARVAAEAYLAGVGIALDEGAVRSAARETVVRGRVQVVAEDPLTVLDGAHNPDAARALVESLGELLKGADERPRGEAGDGSPSTPYIGPGEDLIGTLYRGPGEDSIGTPYRGPAEDSISTPYARPLALVMGVLEDKDAASMLAALLPLSTRAWFTAPPSSRALSPAALQSLARQQGFEETECEPNPRRALALAQEWARAQPGAAVLATGSIYLVGDLLAELAERDVKREGSAGDAARDANEDTAGRRA